MQTTEGKYSHFTFTFKPRPCVWFPTHFVLKTKQKNEKLMQFFISVSTKSVDCDQNMSMNVLDEKVEGRVKLIIQN